MDRRQFAQLATVTLASPTVPTNLVAAELHTANRPTQRNFHGEHVRQDKE